MTNNIFDIFDYVPIKIEGRMGLTKTLQMQFTLGVTLIPFPVRFFSSVGSVRIGN